MPGAILQGHCQSITGPWLELCWGGDIEGHCAGAAQAGGTGHVGAPGSIGEVTVGDTEHHGTGTAPAVPQHWGLRWGGDTGDTVPSTAGQRGAGGPCIGQRGPCGATILCMALTRLRRLPSSAVESKSTVSILDDIGSMFDDLADQLDAMLE